MGRIGKHLQRVPESLASQNIAYEGMMYRHVIEHLDVDKLPYEKYVFVGFNVLNKVEHTLFTQLKDVGKAVFIGITTNFI